MRPAAAAPALARGLARGLARRLARGLALTLTLGLQAPPLAATPPTEQQCLDRFRAETSRIERRFAARRRAAAASAPAADPAWARDLHAALAKAADEGEACSRQARKAQR